MWRPMLFAWVLLWLPALAFSGIVEREYPLNDEIAPCADFYRHVCSRVTDNFTLPDNQSAYLFSAMDAQSRILAAYQDYLAQLLERQALSAHEHLLKNFYQACMDPAASAADERRRVAEVRQLLQGIDSREAFQELVAAQIDSGETALLMLETLPNQGDPDWRDIVISSNLRSLPERSYYHDAAVMADFTALVTLFYQTIGVADAPRHARWISEFEIGFAESFPSAIELRTIELDRSQISRQQLLQQYPALRLEKLLQRLPADSVIRDLTPANYAFLDRILREYSLERLKSLYLFTALSPIMDDAYADYMNAKLAFGRKHLGDSPQRPDRRQRCSDAVIGLFDAELDAALLPRLFADFPRQPVLDLVQRVRAAAAQTLRRNRWLSEQGKAGALSKLARMRLQLVAPDNEAQWDYTLPADYRPDQPIHNHILYWDKYYEKLLRRLGKPRDWHLWKAGPLTVDAMYTASENRFALFQGILQPTFYDPDASDYENLGSLGSVVGHELGHAIDDKGVHFDAQGRLKTWMSEDDIAAFQHRARSLLAYLSAAGHNAELQLAEQIGDMVGLQFAYAAAWPLIEDSPDKQQRFFIRYARNWCVVIRPGMLEVMTRTDPHPLGAARVNENLRHHAGFASAFSCQADDPMVLPASERITIW